MEIPSNPEAHASMFKVLAAVEVSSRDRAFAEDIIASHPDWLNNGKEDFPPMTVLSDLLEEKFLEVSVLYKIQDLL